MSHALLADDVYDLSQLHRMCADMSTPESAFDIAFDEGRSLLNVTLKADRLPLFTQVAVHNFCAFLQALDAELVWGAPIKVVAYRSPHKGAFSYGGDMAMLSEVVGRDAAEMRKYGTSCVDMVWRNWALGMNHDVITIALVTGDALGGGFECALSCDHVAAVASANIGFPEINVGLFPGMGAVPFGVRRAGLPVIRRMLTSGRALTGAEAAAAGLVDDLVEVPEGGDAHAAMEAWFDGWIEGVLAKFSAHRARLAAERRALPVTEDDIAANVKIMVDGVAQADPSQAKRMRTLALMQSRRFRPAA